MDKLMAFFKNIWFKRGVALLGWGYTFLMVWIAYLSFGYYFEIDNPTPLFVLYLFVNLCAAAVFIFSRKQVFTQVNSYIIPPIIFVILICAFGNWYIIVPPAVVMLLLFFANGSNETLKTVLGTMYLLMFVIGVVGYIGIQIFMGSLTLTGVDLSKRDKTYEKVSDSGDYRIVRYFDTNGLHNIQNYYIEETKDDINIPLGRCKKVFGCKSIYTAAYVGVPKDAVSWCKVFMDGVEREVLMVEGLVRENPYLIEEIDEDEASSTSSSRTSSFEESSDDPGEQSSEDSGEQSPESSDSPNV